MKLAIVAVMAIGLGVVGWNAYAQEDKRQALAEELLDAMNMPQVVEKSFDAAKKMVSMQIKRMRDYPNKAGAAPAADKASDEALQKVMDMVSKDLSWEALKDEYVAIYAETFTEEELQAAVAFYTSPQGKTFAQKQPALIEESMKISQKHMMELMPKIMVMAKDLKNKGEPKPETPQAEEK